MSTTPTPASVGRGFKLPALLAPGFIGAAGFTFAGTGGVEGATPASAVAASAGADAWRGSAASPCRVATSGQAMGFRGVSPSVAAACATFASYARAASSPSTLEGMLSVTMNERGLTKSSTSSKATDSNTEAASDAGRSEASMSAAGVG